MIGFIKGTIAMSLEGSLLIENNGIGYQVHVPETCSALLKAGTKEEVLIYTIMVVREDDISLYGFTSQSDLAMFKLLTGVNGVGTKAAMSMLSVLSASEISKAILFDDTVSISRAQGIGKKTAQRVIMELKDKIGDLSGLSGREAMDSGGELMDGDAKTEALQALIALGYSKSEAGEVLMKLKSDYDTAEEYIKAALKKLM